MTTTSLFRLTICGLALSTFASCSGGSGGDGSPGGGNKPKTPQTPEEAISQLSESDRAQFESWKKALTKSCNASEAFGTTKESVDSRFGWGIDAAQFAEKNQGSSVVRLQNEVVFISGYETISSTGKSTYKMNSNINGSQYSIEANTERSGSNCKLYISGQLVHEAIILSNFSVHGYLNPVRAAVTKSSSVDVKSIQAPNAQGKAEAYSQGLAELIKATFEPNDNMTVMLSKRFGITEVEARKAFVKTVGPQNTALRLAFDNNSLWTHTHANPNVISHRNTLDGVFKTNQSASLELSVKNNVIQFSKPEIRIGEPGRFTLNLNFSTAMEPNGISFSTSNIQLGGVQSPSYELAKQCFLNRLTTYKLDTPTRGISPSYDIAAAPCEYLTADFRKEMAPLNRILIPMMFSHLQPVLPFQFNGWDSILRTTVLDVLANNENLLQVLDPSKTNPFVQRISVSVSDIKSVPTLKPVSDELKLSLNNLAITWALALKNADASSIQRIVLATSNSYPNFPGSTQTVLMQLGWDPDSQIAELDFAKNLSDSYASVAVKARDLAQALNYSEFMSKVYNRILQDRPGTAQLQQWVSRLETVQKGLNAHGEKLVAVRGELTKASIGWLDSKVVQESEISSIYATLAKVGTVFPESLKTLIDQLGQDYNSHKVALKFIDEISPDFITSANRIKELSAKLGMESKGTDFFNSILQKRPTFQIVKQLETTWAEANDFSIREIARVKESHTSPWAERNRKEFIERGIEEGWGPAEFQGLETIAELAKFKTMCERYPDRSSLADCARDDRFSKASKKLFDPSFGNRYAVLSKLFVSLSEKPADFKHQNLKSKLNDGFFGSFELVWDKCTNELFSSKQSTLAQQANQYLNEQDQFKLWDLERKIDETLKNCN